MVTCDAFAGIPDSREISSYPAYEFFIVKAQDVPQDYKEYVKYAVDPILRNPNIPKTILHGSLPHYIAFHWFFEGSVSGAMRP